MAVLRTAGCRRNGVPHRLEGQRSLQCILLPAGDVHGADGIGLRRVATEVTHGNLPASACMCEHGEWIISTLSSYSLWTAGVTNRWNVGCDAANPSGASVRRI